MFLRGNWRAARALLLSTKHFVLQGKFHEGFGFTVRLQVSIKMAGVVCVRGRLELLL